jgi:hypothetical protein
MADERHKNQANRIYKQYKPNAGQPDSSPSKTSVGTSTGTCSEFDVLHVRRVVAGNPNTPQLVLSRLADDSTPHIRRRVAENPKTPSEVLSRLARDAHSDVRLAVAENPSTPPDVLSWLATDEDMDVRYGVAENPHMPEEILFKLSEDDNPYIRCRALKTLQMLDPQVQSRIKMMMNWHVQRQVM